MRDAFGRHGWVWGGLNDALYGFGKLFVVIVLIVVGAVLVKWGYTEYYISAHCTMVLGTRVCQ